MIQESQEGRRWKKSRMIQFFLFIGLLASADYFNSNYFGGKKKPREQRQKKKIKKDCLRNTSKAKRKVFFLPFWSQV